MSPRIGLQLTLVTLACLVACTPAREAASTHRADSTPDDSARLQRDVEWLADDARQGRRAGTEEARLAADWLGQRFAELQLVPAGEAGSFFQSFEVPLPARAGETSLVRQETDSGSRMVSELGGVIPLFCAEGGTVEGPLAFRGFGIESHDQDWDDFRAGDLQGAIVVLLRGTPPDSELIPARPPAAGEVEHAATFEGTGSIFVKVMNAKRHGAAGVILLQEAGASAPLPFDSGQAARAGIPALSATRELFAALVGEERAKALCEQALHRSHPDFGAPDSALRTRIVADVRRERGIALNVLARLEGAERNRTVIIGAHYDHLGLGGEGSLAPGANGQVHNGADDNASGTAVVLEMARVLAAGPKPAGDVVFALWSGEELGLLGSEYWCEHPTFPLASLRANLNLDMVGRARPPGDRDSRPSLTVLGAGTSEAFEAWLATAGEQQGLALQVNRSGFGTGGSDHMSFMKREIPVLHFFTGVHPDYHKPTDDSDKVDSPSMARIAALGIDLVARMQAAPELAWSGTQTKGMEEARQAPAALNGDFRAWFGAPPVYSFEGPGVLVQTPGAGSPAEKAGLMAGDVLLQIADVRIDRADDYGYALRVYKPGDVVLVRYLRKGVEESVRVTLATRAAQ